MDEKATKRIHSVYRNNKSMVTGSIVGLIIPIILFIAAGLGFLYAFHRTRLLKDIDEGRIDVSDDPALVPASIHEEISYIRKHNLVYHAPLFLIGFIVLVVALVIIGSQLGYI